MLKSLFIKNYALIDAIAVEPSNGLVIITGETGAGKSIIIDALGMLLGNRASGDVVRSGAERAIVEGVFLTSANKKLKTLLTENELDAPDDLIVRREITAKGQSRSFVSDTPVTLALLKKIGELLVDLHGQHEHQSLLRVETHIGLVDDFGGLDAMVEEYRSHLTEMRDLSRRIEELRDREQQLAEKRDFYAFQMKEIDAVDPRPGEEESLEAEFAILENAEKLFAATGQMYEALYEGEKSVHDMLVVIRNQLEDLTGIDRQFTDAAKECSSAEAIVSELAKFIQSYNARIEFNPERLEALRERLGTIALLKKKYGGSLEAVLAHREKIREEIALAENFDGILAGLDEEYRSAQKECAVHASRLSAKRHDVAKKIDQGIGAELGKLGIRNGRFLTRIEQREVGDGETRDAVASGTKRLALNARGFDEVEFYLSTNLGEQERPLVDVASGGEVSRVMLALKSILAKSDRLPVLIFDEIDVGVSGRVAQSVGLSLKALSSFHQVIAITHLPQIAGLADTHFVVEKSEHEGRTTTALRKLSLDEQVQEVAKLMSGAEVTTAGLAGARELMGLK